MKEFHLEIVTPDGVMFSDLCESVLLHTESGDVEILAGHADYFASLAIGRARIKQKGASRFAAAQGGFVSVQGGKVRVALTTFEFGESIDIARARKAKAEAEEALKAAKDDKSADYLKARLMRAVNRINAWELKK